MGLCAANLEVDRANASLTYVKGLWAHRSFVIDFKSRRTVWSIIHLKLVTFCWGTWNHVCAASTTPVVYHELRARSRMCIVNRKLFWANASFVDTKLATCCRSVIDHELTWCSWPIIYHKLWAASASIVGHELSVAEVGASLEFMLVRLTSHRNVCRFL